MTNYNLQQYTIHYDTLSSLSPTPAFNLCLTQSSILETVTKTSTTQISEFQTSKWGSRAISLNMAHQRNSLKLPWCQRPHAAPDRLKFQPKMLKVEHMFQGNVNNTKSIEILYFLVDITGNPSRPTGDHWSSNQFVNLAWALMGHMSILTITSHEK